MRTQMRLLLGLPACLAIALSVGCGEPMSYVTGTVTFDGEPAADYQVVFAPNSPELGSGFAKTDARGRYELVTSRTVDGVKPGSYKVKITGPVEYAAEFGDEPPAGAVPVPARYHGNNTELSAQIETGRTTLDFDLTSNPDSPSESEDAPS
jgi:hypothetical protein